MGGRILDTQGSLPLEAVGFGIAAGNRLTLVFILACAADISLDIIVNHRD